MIACTGPSRMSWPVMLKRTPRYAKPNASRARERARGATAYRLEAGKPIERLEQFDPQVMQIIMVHRYRESARTPVVPGRCGFSGCRLEA